MLNYSNFAIVASIFGLWINSFLSHQLQLWLGFVLIFSFGVLHGSNDLALFENINARSGAVNYKFLFYYVVAVIAGAALFYLIPSLALAIFILVSGYHFGEQQWINQISLEINWLKFLFQLVYGLLILFLIFTFQAEEVGQIVFEITSRQIPSSYFLNGLKIIGVILGILGTLVYLKSNNFKNVILRELFYLLVFIIIFKVSSLIWGFALYFILWHSIPSMQDQIKFLYGKIDVKSIKSYLWNAFPYWIISLIGLTLLYVFLKDQKIFNALFFSFLASITFPHVIVIIKMFDKR